MSKSGDATAQDKPAGQAQEATGRVKVDTSNLKSSYCNVCNATSTREEVVLNFGINQNWDLGPQAMEVQLAHRIILSPFAAKRLADMLNKLMNEYEMRHGELK